MAARQPGRRWTEATQDRFRRWDRNVKNAVSRGRLLGVGGTPTKQLMDREDVNDRQFNPRDNGNIIYPLSFLAYYLPNFNLRKLVNFNLITGSIKLYQVNLPYAMFMMLQLISKSLRQ